MAKKITTLYLEEDLVEELRSKNINISEFVNDAIAKNFRNSAKLKEEKEMHLRKAREIDALLDSQNIAIGIIYGSLDASIKKFLAEVTNLVQEGKEESALCKRFNKESGQNLSISEFMCLARFAREKV